MSDGPSPDSPGDQSAGDALRDQSGGQPAAVPPLPKYPGTSQQPETVQYTSPPSADQPPGPVTPGGWAAPDAGTQPGYGQQAGYGQPPAYGQPPPGSGYPPYGASGYTPWQAPPPVPAPGGVPLRPLAVGDILSGAFTLIRQNPKATLGLAAIVQTISAVLSTLISWGELGATNQFRASVAPGANPNDVGTAFGHFFTALVPFIFLSVILTFLIQSVLTGMLTGALGEGLLGNKITIGQAWGMARVGSIIGVTLLSGLITFGLFIPVVALTVLLAIAKVTVGAVLVGVLGGLATVGVEIFVFVRLSLAIPAVVLERAGPVTALRRSWQLVAGSWWRIFGISLLTALIVFLVAAVLEVPFGILGAVLGGGSSPFAIGTTTTTVATTSALALIIGAIGNIIATTCTRPISAGVTVLLYTDMRMRKEGLDLALAQAGRPGGQAPTGQEFVSLWKPGTGQADPAAPPGAPPAW